MTDADTDPVAAFRIRLQDLFVQVRRPTYRSLETHADHDGRALRTSTVSNLLNGPGTPRWDTVETFVRACAHYAHARQIRLATDLVDLDRWHADYQTMENALADQAARREQIAGRAVPARRRRLAIPAQLPPDVSSFTGRTQHLADLDRLLPSHDQLHPAYDRATAVVISAIDGTAGVGKTALAVHWAHQVRDRFPDGQLYVNLRGFDPSGQIMNPATAVRGFLHALEIPPARIPADPDAQAALYRSLLIDKRMLIVLDNARDSAQVRPLLPGAPGCLVLVTSRNQLTSLIATHGAHPLTLDLLTPSEARDLLAHRLGTDRITAEPNAVEEIITSCARLPLALTLVVAHAAIRPAAGLRNLADELRGTQARWHTLAGDDPSTDVHTVFSWSYQALTPRAARLFRLLGQYPGPGISAPAAASLYGQPIDAVRPLLADLARSNLLTEHTPGRYTLHDLLRAYATHLTHTTDPETERHAATHRILDHYLHTGYASACLLSPAEPPPVPAPPQPGVTPENVADQQQALAWFSTEHSVLVAALAQATSSHLVTHTFHLAWYLWIFLERQGRWHDLVLTESAALQAMRYVDDLPAQVTVHRALGMVYTRLGRYQDACREFRSALDLSSQLDDRISQAGTHRSIAGVLSRENDYPAAISHAEQALRLYHLVGDRCGQANMLGRLGWYHALSGNHRRALAFCRQAAALRREIGKDNRQGDTLATLGYAYHELGYHLRAIECLREALAAYRETGCRHDEAAVLIRVADIHIHHAIGDPTTARDTYLEALSVLTDLDHPDADTVRAKLAALGTPS